MTELPIIVNTNEVTVGGVVDQVELQLSVGAQGERGSRIFSGDVSPLTLPVDSPYFAGYTEFIPGDVYIERSVTVLALWEWKSQPGGYTWVQTATISTGEGGSGFLDADLEAIAALTGTNGLLRKTATNTWVLDTNSYLTSNQSITLSGDVTGTGTSSITTTVADDSHSHTSSTISALDAGDTTTGTFNIARIPTGTTGTTVALGNHTHSGYQAADNDLTAIAAISGTGYLRRTGVDTWTLDTPATATWGGITGTLSSQTDLQNALNAKQAADNDLTAIAALAGTSGFLKKTATDTWALDTSTYLTSNQTITLSGDASGSGTTAITVTVADDSHAHTGSTISGLDAGDTTTGTFNIARIPTGSTGTTVSLGNHTHSYQPVDNDLTAIAALAGTSGFLKKTATDTWALDTNTYLTANQSITLSGDATGSGATAITVTVVDDSHSHTGTTISALDAGDTTTGTFNIARIPTGSTGTTVSLGNHTHSYQAVDGDLTAIAALTGTGFLQRTGTDTWSLAAAGTGDVVGPSSATDNGIALFNTTTGKLIKDGLVTLTGSGTPIKVSYGSGNPTYDLNVSAPPGSIHFSSNATSGYSHGIWFKNSGTDTTGWEPVARVDNELVYGYGEIALFSYGEGGSQIEASYLRYTVDTIGDLYHLYSGGEPLNLQAPYDTGEGWSDRGVLYTGPLNISGVSETSRISVYNDPQGDSGTLVFSVDETGKATTTLLNIPHASAPGTPVNGDIWTTSAGVYARINGVTQGPFESAAGSYQPASGDLTAIDALAGTSGFLKKTATDTWTLDTNTYLTANQPITLSGVVTGSGTTAITTSFATSPAFSGTPTAPTAAVDTNTTQLATTAYVVGQGYLKSATASSTYAPINNPTFTGTVTATTFSGSGASLTSIPQSAVTNLTTDLSGKSPLAGSSSIQTVGTIYTGNWNAGPVTSRYFYQWANGEPTSNLGSPTVSEMALFDSQFNNKLWFYDPTKFTFTYTMNGTDWITQSNSTSEIKNLVGGAGATGSNISIPNLAQKYRIDIRNDGTYVYTNALYMYFSTNSHQTKVHIWKKRDDGSWTQVTSSNTNVSSWPGHLYLPFNTIPWSTALTGGHYNDIRIEFTPTWTTGGSYDYTNISLINLEIWGGYPAGRRTIYNWDSDKNVTFPAALTATTTISGSGLAGSLLSSTNPLMDGAVAVGTSAIPSRQDHVHPVDTSRSPVAGSSSITTVGTIGSGTWQGSVVAGQYGGTGVANTGKTITVSGNTTIGSSTHTVAFATSGNTSITLPTSGTLEVTGHTHAYQPIDADLTAIAALAGTSGLLKKTAADTWTLDTTAYTTNTGTVTSVAMTVPTGLSISGTPVTTSGTLALTLTSGYSIPTTSSQTNWDTAYTDRNKWDGGSSGLTASTGRTSLGATTVGSNLFTLTNPTAITFLRVNADNTVSTLDAATFRTAIGAGTSSTTGTVTSVGMSVPTGLSISGTPVTTSGTLAVTLTAGYEIPTTAALAAKAPLASPTFTGKVTTAATAVGGAGFSLPHGTAPSSPANGDVWSTTAGVYARINGVTIGPFAAASGGATWGSITGTLSSQSDLNTALNGKAATNQTMYIGTQAIAINAGSGTITSLAGVTSMGSLATVGTITSGTWSATAIADNKIASALTGKTYNALTLTAAATGFTIAGGTTSKTLTVSNTLTLAGTDSSTLNIGTGGTLGTAAYTASTAYLSSSTSSAQAGYFGDIYLYDDSTPSQYLQTTNSANLTATTTLSMNVNDAARAVSLSGDLTVSGAASISGTHTGTSSGSNTGDQTITLTGNVTGSGTGSFAATIANDAVTYAKMQNVSAQYRVLGRISASAGDTEELTGENLVTVLGQATSKTGTGSIVFHTTPTFSGTVSTGAPGGYNSFIAGSTSNVGNSITDGSFVANRDDHAIMYLLAQGTSGTAARIRGWVAGGTAASKTVPAASSLLLSIDARGWGGTNYVGGAAIEFSLGTGTFSDSSMPGKIQLQTVPDGSTTRQTRLTIDQNGFSTFASAANGTTLSVTNSAYNAEIHASGTGDGLMTLTANGAAGNYAYNKMRTRWGQASQNELHTGLASDGSWFVSQKTINGSSVSRDNLLNVSSGGEITFNPVNAVQINGRLIFPSTKSIRLRAGNVSTGTDEYELMGHSDGNLWLSYNNPFSTFVRDLAMFKPDGTLHLAQPGYGIEYGSAGPRHMVYSSDPTGIDVPVGSTWRQTSANSTYGNLTGLLWNKVGTGTTLGTDWLVDFEGRWITYTVTTTNVTIGTGGTVTGKYTRTGKTITCRVRLVLGTSGSFSGTVALSLPATGTSLADTVYAGNVVMRDSGVSANWGLVSIGNNATTFGIVYAAGTQPAIGNSVGSGSTPFTWGNADNFHAQFTYESA